MCLPADAQTLHHHETAREVDGSGARALFRRAAHVWSGVEEDRGCASCAFAVCNDFRASSPLPSLTSYPDGAEHIGSKTAVQIRSHAQKFFSKLEKQEMSGAKGEGAFAWESISSTSIWVFMCPTKVRSGRCPDSQLPRPVSLCPCH